MDETEYEPEHLERIEREAKVMMEAKEVFDGMLDAMDAADAGEVDIEGEGEDEIREGLEQAVEMCEMLSVSMVFTLLGNGYMPDLKGVDGTLDADTGEVDTSQRGFM